MRCEICGLSEVRAVRAAYPTRYKGREIVIPDVERYECYTCEEQYFTSEQLHAKRQKLQEIVGSQNEKLDITKQAESLMRGVKKFLATSMFVLAISITVTIIDSAIGVTEALKNLPWLARVVHVLVYMFSGVLLYVFIAWRKKQK